MEVREAEKLSIRALASRFHVSKHFIETLLKLYQETGSVPPRPHGGGAHSKLNTEQLSPLESLVEKHNDATLAKLAERLHQETGIALSPTTIHRQLKKMGYSLKKTTYPEKKPLLKYSGKGLNIGNSSGIFQRKISLCWMK